MNEFLHPIFRDILEAQRRVVLKPCAVCGSLDCGSVRCRFEDLKPIKPVDQRARESGL